MSSHHRLLAPIAAALLAGGCTTPPATNPAEEPTAPLSPDRDSDIQRVFDRIARMEDERQTGNGELQRLALAAEAAVRLRATRALSRLPYPELGTPVTDGLIAALKDDAPAVRAMAAFGLGQRADPASIEAILKAWKDKEPAVRARLVEAGSRFEDPAIREEVLYAISDPSPLVRAEAVLAPSRWDPEGRGAAIVDSALANVAARAPAKLRRDRWGLPDGAGLEVEVEEPEVIWRALFSLSRRKSERGRDVFYLWCRALESVEARIFATKGIANLAKRTDPCMEALREALADEDWRVAVEAAVGLGRFPEAVSLGALEAALDHSVVNVRITAIEALGFFAGERLVVKPLLEELLVDTSPNVRAAAILSLARLFSDEIVADLELRSLDADPRIRIAVAKSAEFLASSLAVPLLVRLTSDEDHGVAFAATSGLGNHLKQGGRDRVDELLRDPDNGLRLAAVTALRQAPSRQDLQPLLTCFTTSTGDLSDEIRYEILETAALVPDDRAFEILATGLRDRRPFTRQTASRLLAQYFPEERTPEVGKLPPRRGEVPSIDGRRSNPLVEVKTSRGTLVFELFPVEAPIHVFNFLTLAQRGVYDGLDFHRVVPDFVIQGGDYRGDGNGGESWRGEPLRSEFGPRKHVRGSLGMPRYADPDSGGGQFYVTHRPTPHLDGQYTVFGELRQGWSVLDSIEVGDRITGVRLRGADAGR